MSERSNLSKFEFQVLIFFANKFVWAIFGSSTNLVLLKIDVHVHFMMAHVSHNRLTQLLLIAANLCNL